MLNGINADPKWANLGARDFHLTAGSPAIDSANSGISGQPGSDVAGVARVDDPATPNPGVGPRTYDDRGAYEFQPSGDLPPSVALVVSPSSGVFPLPVSVDASGSSDGDATPIASYKFDFGDGSAVVGPQAGATATHTYSVAGTYVVTATVTDTGGQVLVDDTNGDRRGSGAERHVEGDSGLGDAAAADHGGCVRVERSRSESDCELQLRFR